MAGKPPDAFLSYTRFDDQRDRGKISQFRQELADEVRAVTGEPFEIFQDVEGIGLGEHWPEKLDEILAQARFFIPIMTPSYFNSAACRDELQKFLRAEEKAGRKDLILPIYCIQCRVLEEKELREGDPLAQALSERERSNWQELRHYSFRNRKVRLALEALAREMDQARRRVVPGGAATVRRQDSAGVDEPAPHRESRQPADAARVAKRTQHEVEEEKAAERQTNEEERERAEAERREKEEQARRRAEEVEAKRRTEEGRRRPAPKGPEPGTIFRDLDAPWCPELVVIAPGEFMMGSLDGDPDAFETERPRHLVKIAYLLAVGRFPVTFEEYDHFAEATRRKPPRDNGWGRERRPVINVSWDDAEAYAKWLAAETGQLYRLLSEAEWEYACRAGTTSRYWWGDEITAEKANYGRNVGKTSEVGSYPVNPFGLYDMHGNVWEWVEDCWNDSYKSAPDDGSAWTSTDCNRRVLRGGSWSNLPVGPRSASRDRFEPDYRTYFIGFRVARTLSRSESVTS